MDTLQEKVAREVTRIIREHNDKGMVVAVEVVWKPYPDSRDTDFICKIRVK